MRPVFLALLAAAPACIVYEVGINDRRDRNGDVPTDPTESGVVDQDLYLSVASGDPGTDLVSTLESRSGLDFQEYGTLRFERDVAVLDEVVRGDDVLLLLRVAPDALPGPVAAVASSMRDQTRELSAPFIIRGEPKSSKDSGAPTDDSGTPSKTTPTGDTSASTTSGDTGTSTP